MANEKPTERRCDHGLQIASQSVEVPMSLGQQTLLTSSETNPKRVSTIYRKETLDVGAYRDEDHTHRMHEFRLNA